MTMHDVPLLRLADISKTFGGIAAVDHASFSVARGTIVGLIGPNGSGKSTILNMVSKLLRPSSGQVWFENRLISHLPPYRVAQAGIARTFQLLRLFHGLSVYDNVLAATYLTGSHGVLGAIAGRLITSHEEERLRQRARETLQFVGLDRRADVLARHLTAGEGRLLELARALAASPKLILLDEPAAGLNNAETETLEDKLRTLRARGQSLLLVDHHMSLVMRLADRVIVLNQGRVLSEGTPAEVQRDPAVVQAYLGTGALPRRRRTHA